MRTTQPAQLLARLKTTEGHLRGIGRMVEAEAYCIDIIKQVQATQRALDKWNNLVLEDHLNSCVTDAIREDQQSERERVIDELNDIFQPPTRVQASSTRNSGPTSAAQRIAWLRQIEAQVRDVQRMVEGEAYCIDLIKATQAINSELSRFSSVVLNDHLNGCVTTAIRGEHPDERTRVVSELLQVFDTTSRL